MHLWTPLFLLFSTIAWADEASYLNVNAWEAQKITAGIIAAEPQFLATPAEKIEWARARLAAISLARLQAKEEEALKLFGGCVKVCGEYGNEAEWKAAKAWGCQKKRHTDVCLGKN